ncbi:hypothetical protein PR048_030470 [Dryococelus australis]|uniref:Uncharacterized protein n=1 Tax=Dryococelus australis TaxID=614101 RepID=A0ABQ9G934_9NEOP|nr:hypothetical protein PR048_030470 [Dryococelus australis]
MEVTHVNCEWQAGRRRQCLRVATRRDPGVLSGQLRGRHCASSHLLVRRSALTTVAVASALVYFRKHQLGRGRAQEAAAIAPPIGLASLWFETRSEVGSKIDTENCCTIRVERWTGDRDEVHFEPPKLTVRNLDPTSAAIGINNAPVFVDSANCRNECKPRAIRLVKGAAMRLSPRAPNYLAPPRFSLAPTPGMLREWKRKQPVWGGGEGGCRRLDGPPLDGAAVTVRRGYRFPTNRDKMNETAVIKFLGLKVDNFLNWKSHIAYILPKLSSACFVLRSIAEVLNKNTAKMRAVIIINGKRKSDSCRPLFKSSEILTFACEYMFSVLIFMSRNSHLFHKNESFHKLDTRIKITHVASVNLKLVQKGPSYFGSQLFNKLPQHLQEICFSNQKQLKEFFSKLTFYSRRSHVLADPDALALNLHKFAFQMREQRACLKINFGRIIGAVSREAGSRLTLNEDPTITDLICTVQRHDGNTARLARRSDEALGVRASVARIAPSLLDLGRAAPSHP